MGGVISVVTSISGAISRNPMLSYFLVLAVLLLDGGLSFFTGLQGVFGVIISLVVNALGVPIQVYSWQVLILIALIPIFRIAIEHSKS